MKKLTFMALGLFSVLIALSSCGDPKPVPPPPPPPPIPDGQIAKIEVTSRLGHLHGSLFHGNPTLEDTDFPQKGRQAAEFVYDTATKTFKQSNPDNIFRWVSHTVWSLELVTFDNKNNRMNSVFVDKGADSYHQLFIYADNMHKYQPKGNKKGEAVSLTLQDIAAPFVYRDTDPEYEMFVGSRGKPGHPKVVLTKKNLGLKGYFHDPKTEMQWIGFKEAHYTYDLHLNMVRFATSNDKGNRTAFAWETGFQKLSVFHLVIPVRVVTEHPADDTAADYIKDIADEYNMDEVDVSIAFEESWGQDIEKENCYM